MTVQQDLEPVITESLTKLETALLTPQVSGELDGWVQSVREATSELGSHLREYLDDVLHAQYVQIAKVDNELLTQVEQMIAEDKNLLCEFDGFVAELDTLTTRVPSAEKDELKVADHRQHLEARGTALILRIRKQRTAAATWMSEAFYRDRGRGD